MLLLVWNLVGIKGNWLCGLYSRFNCSKLKVPPHLPLLHPLLDYGFWILYLFWIIIYFSQQSGLQKDKCFPSFTRSALLFVHVFKICWFLKLIVVVEVICWRVSTDYNEVVLLWSHLLCDEDGFLHSHQYLTGLFSYPSIVVACKIVRMRIGLTFYLFAMSLKGKLMSWFSPPVMFRYVTNAGYRCFPKVWQVMCPVPICNSHNHTCLNENGSDFFY
jgi:hypothetical protein